ncbi:hypothetical protein LEP1GSC192_0379 [Leptospira sp. B5-022]|nr:hypothetical protein LEP1GSC192_0379 [Leptospira sp. B5-022]
MERRKHRILFMIRTGYTDTIGKTEITPLSLFPSSLKSCWN